MNILTDLLADGPITALHFHTGGGSSRSVRAFIAELAAVLSGSPKKPLLVAGETELTAIFRFFEYAELRDARGRNITARGIGKRFADIADYPGSVRIGVQHGSDHECDITVPEGKWESGRTPENTARSALPVFDSDSISRAVAALLERWVQAGTLVDVEPSPSSFQKWQPEYTSELDISTDPGDWDPARTRDPAVVEEVRRLRRERGLSNR